MKGWWVDVRGWVAWVVLGGGGVGGEEDGDVGIGEEGAGEDVGVKRGKDVIQSGANPVGAGMRAAFTAARWRARRRLPSGVAPPVNGALGRACRTRRSPGSSDCCWVIASAASKPKGWRPCKGALGSWMKIPGAPEGLAWKGAAEGESRNVLMNWRVLAGEESGRRRTRCSIIGFGRWLSLLIRSAGSICSIRDMRIARRVSGLSEPYSDIALS